VSLKDFRRELHAAGWRHSLGLVTATCTVLQSEDTLGAEKVIIKLSDHARENDWWEQLKSSKCRTNWDKTEEKLKTGPSTESHTHLLILQSYQQTMALLLWPSSARTTRRRWRSIKKLAEDPTQSSEQRITLLIRGSSLPEDVTEQLRPHDSMPLGVIRLPNIPYRVRNSEDPFSTMSTLRVQPNDTLVSFEVVVSVRDSLNISCRQFDEGSVRMIHHYLTSPFFNGRLY
jgi:hypothetical protein